MSRVRAWLELVRAAALPTALADVWLGAAWLTPFWMYRDKSITVAALSLISLALYGAGMILNDMHDVDIDREENPGRPLPRGAISVCSARRAGIALWAAGVGGAFALGGLSGWIALALALLVVSYDFGLSRTRLGPLAMGGCRVLNVCLGMSIGCLGGARDMLGFWYVLLPIFVYVTCVSYIARREAERPRRREIVLPLLGMVLGVLLALSTPLWVRLTNAGQEDAGAALFSLHVAAPAAVLLFCVVMAWVCSMRRTGSLRRGVTYALMGIVPLQAAVAGAVDLRVMYAILLLLVPVFFLRLLSHIT